MLFSFRQKMVPLVSFLAALRILTEAQICNNGEGKIAYEKTVTSLNNRFKRLDELSANSTPEHQFGFEVLQRSELPLRVLEGCFQKCQDDKLTKLSNCAKFDFLAGKRLTPDEGATTEAGSDTTKSDANLSIYEPSKCVFYNVSHGNLEAADMKDVSGPVLEFKEVCLSAQTIQRVCPNRAYIFETIPGYRLADPNSKAHMVADKTECQNLCLNEQSFSCRSAQFEPLSKKCYLSATNRHSMPDKFKSEGHFEYMENLCLKHNEMCKWNVFIIEKEKKMSPELEKLALNANSVVNCSNQCLESIDKFGFICRAFMFDDSSKTCVLYDEDPLDEMKSEEENTKKLVTGKGNLYRVLCSTDDKDKELDNKTLECHRHKRLRGRHHVEMPAANFYECLTGCMRQFGRDCRAIEFSQLQQTCRFSGKGVGPYLDDESDPLLDDNTFDYYDFKWNQDELEPEKLASDKLAHERQDPIEASNSQPGANYNNFVLPSGPIEQVRVTNNIDDIRPSMPDARRPMPDHRLQMPENRDSKPDYRPQMPDNKPSMPDYRQQFPANRPQMPDNRLQGPDGRPRGAYDRSRTEGAEIEQFRVSSTPYQIQQIREPQIPQYPTKGTSPIPMPPQRKPQIVYPDPYYKAEQRRESPTPAPTPLPPTQGLTPAASNADYGRKTHVSTYPERRLPEQRREEHDRSRTSSGPAGTWNGSFRYTTMSPRSGFVGVGQSRINQTPEGRYGSGSGSGSGTALPPYSIYSQHTHHHLPPSPANKLLLPGGGSIQSTGSYSSGGHYVNGHLMSSSSSISSASTDSSISSSSSSVSISYDKYGNKNTNCKAPGETEVELLGPKFKRVGFSTRLKSKHIYKVVRADTLEECEKYCLDTKDFECKSFNYRAFFPDNCELSSVDSVQYPPESTENYETNSQFDFYEKHTPSPTSSALTSSSTECIEVLQNCSPEGMEFKLRTPEGFYGRIYSYGFYDSCFFDGNGATESMLKLSAPNGFPRCGTQSIGDGMSTIVVVQFNDFVQTSRDKMYNLTCYISGPGEAVVTSSYLDTKMEGRHPMQIEHLPAQNVLSNNVLLRINYRGNPTSTIVVGDLLTFRLESKNKVNYNGYYQDIFATNVIAKDPYTGRQVLLIDGRGCPVDIYVFPELHKTADGGLEAEFYAFKIPDSNFLVFQATVRTCKGPCEPVICSDRNRSPNTFPSYGRRRRSTNMSMKRSDRTLDEEEVHGMFKVFLSEEDVPESGKLERPTESPLVEETDRVCLNSFAYYTLLSGGVFATIFVFVLVPYWAITRLIKQRFNEKTEQIGHWPTNLFNSFRRRHPDLSTTGVKQQQQHLNQQHPSMFTPSYAGQGPPMSGQRL